MAQVNGTENQAAPKTTAANLFASLRNSFNVDGVKGGLFSSLLAQSKSAAPLPAVTPDQSAALADGPTSDPAAHAKSGAAAADNQSEDAERVRAALRQVRDDINELRANRKRDEAAQAKAAGTEKKTDTADNAKANDPAPVATQTAKPEEQVSSAKETVAEPMPTEAKTKVEAPLVEAAAQTIVAEDIVAPVNDQPQTDKRTDDEGGKDILAELIQTEQALVLMLQKMLQDKANALTATGSVAQNAAAMTGAVEAVKNGSAKVAANGTNDAVLAAAFGGVASSADAAAPKTDDALVDTIDEFLKPFAALTPKAGQDNTIADKQETKNKAIDVAALFHPVTQNDASPVVVPNNAALTAALANGKAAETNGDAAARPFAATAANANAAPNPMQAEGARPAGSYDFASQLSALRASKGGATGLPAAVEQVTLQLHKMAKSGTDQMTLQLRPAELGRIDIKLEFAKDGSNTVKGIVIADTQATLDMLQKDSGGLQRALQDAGLRADSGSLQFNLRGDGQQNASAQNNNGQASSGNKANSYAVGNEDESALVAASSEETYYLTPGRVNLRV